MIARSFCACAAFLLPLVLPVLHADVTLRYRTEVKMNPNMPAQVAEATMKKMDAAVPPETVLRFKGTKGFSTAMGYDTITDFSTKEITLLDGDARQYAKVKSDQFVEELSRAMPELTPEARAAASSVKADITPTRLTGRTAVILGVQAEQREMVFSMEGPAIPNMPPGPMFKMVMQFWTAKPGEADRIAALREVTDYSLWSNDAMNPAASISKMMKQFPGFADAFGSMQKEMHLGTLLRLHIEMFTPALAAMMQRIPAGSGVPGANLDPAAPLMQIDKELAEISTAPVPDSVFEVPEDYQETGASELIKRLFAKSQAALQQ
jgi:hypothetical protein